MLKSLSPIDVALIKKIGGSGSSYTLPIATETTLGGVKPVTKTDAMTQAVGVDAGGALWTAPGSGGGGSGEAVSWKLIRTINIVSGTSSYSFNTDNNGNAFKIKNFLILIDAYPTTGYLEIKPNGNLSFLQKPIGKQNYPFSFMMERATDGRYILENSTTSNSIFERKISEEYASFGEFTSFSFWFSTIPAADTTMYILGEDVCGGAIPGGDDSSYELAATIEITEPVTSITQNFEKSYKELYIFFDKITASQNTQVVINTLGSENGFAGTTAYYRVSRLIHRGGIGMERQDSTGHGTYGFWQSGGITRRYDLGTDADIDYVTIKPSNPNTTQITGGTFKIYGRV